eukprot:5786758-Alexandrium_andersonii.AAC.1
MCSTAGNNESSCRERPAGQRQMQIRKTTTADWSILRKCARVRNCQPTEHRSTDQALRRDSNNHP